MTCAHCDRENPADAAFCSGCGQRLQLLCRGCSRTNSVDAAFCNGCGRPLEDSEGPATPVPVKAPKDYTPKHLADKILTTKSVLEGERKVVTVLFVDLQSSMALSEGIDPEEWHGILDRFFGILADGVHRYEGTVNQYTGDGIMALFGAPIAHEDHAQRACYAALQLRDDLRKYAQELKRDKGLAFSVRMGLNSGDVVVGKIGDDLRMDYTAQGHTVGLAARMQQLASPDTVYLTEHTAALATGYFELAALGSFNVKGVSGSIEAHELRALGRLRTRLDASRARGFSKFVGRSDEMDALEHALQHARSGHGQVVGVVADAGTGKSRLCFEFLERCRAKGITVYTGTGVAHGKAIPFLPILELFRNYFGITEHDSDEGCREKIAGRLLLIDESFRESLPMVFDFLGVPDPHDPAPRMDPDAWKRQFYALVKRVTQERGQKQLSITMLEDLHWFDDGSEGFLEPMVEATTGGQSLLLVNFRPEYHSDWMGRSYYQQLPLQPLGPDAIRELLDDLLGTDESLVGLAERIYERTAGNPFFIEEVVQTLVEAGSLQGERGHYRLVTSIDHLRVPSTVQAVLGARIDRLKEREKQVLQTGSVIGKIFPERVLQRIAQLPERDLSEALRQLVTSEFVFEEALYPEAEYAFKHPLTQEVAYQSQLGGRRAKVHAATADVIEELYADKLDEQAALLAHHCEQAGEHFKAARWHRRAADWAGTSDAIECYRHWQQARVLLVDHADTPEAEELLLDASIELLNLAWRVGLPGEEADRLFEQCRTLVAQRDDLRLETKLLGSYAGMVGIVQGKAGVYYDVAKRCSEAALASGDTFLQDSVSIYRGYSALTSGHLEEARQVAEEVLSRDPDDGRVHRSYLAIDPYAFAWQNLTATAIEQGDLELARHANAKTIERAQALAEFEIEIWALGAAGMIGYASGEPGNGPSQARRAVELAENVGSPANRILAYLQLAGANLAPHDWKGAAAAAEQVIETIRASRVGRIWEPEAFSYWSEAALGDGDTRRALELADESIACAQRCETVGYESHGQIARARALLQLGAVSASSDIELALDRAAQRIEQTGTGSRLPHVHECRAELAAARDDRTGREAELGEALRLFEQMGATGHARRIQTALGE